MPIEQTKHWTFRVGRSQLQALILFQVDVYLLDIHTAVDDLDDRVRIGRRVVLAPLSKRGIDGMEFFKRPDAIQFVLFRLRQRPVVFAAADIGAESVVI